MSEKSDAPKKKYLGDGVYAYHDGFQVWLETERPEGRHSIALEPDTFNELLQFVGPIWYKEKMN